MKNKKLTYILFPLVLIVWGLIFFKIFSGVGGEEYVSNERFEDDLFIKKDTIAQEQFSLIADYRDPFLGKSQSFRVLKTSIKKNPVVPAVNTLPVIVWPIIRYQGVIENKKKGNRIAIIQVDNQEFLFREKDQYANVSLVKIFKDSIWVSFNNEKKVVRR